MKRMPAFSKADCIGDCAYDSDRLDDDLRKDGIEMKSIALPCKLDGYG
jgi:hypothetical protein